MKKLYFFTGILLLLSSCGGSKKTVEKSTKKTSKSHPKKVVVKQDTDKNLDFSTLKYIAKYADIAKKEMKDYGVPASITMAQGILESQSGKSRLAVEANNHFGIKCHGNDWRGEKILHDDNKARECFRKYDNPEASFKDHSKFLANRKRYAFLFRLPKTDYEAWARGLKKAGYATDPTYPDKLIYIINKYNLSKFDKAVLSEMSVKVDETDTATKDKKKKFIYEVKKGETLFTIARKFNIPVKDIQRINNLNDFDIYMGQILVLTENNEPGNESTNFPKENNTPADEENTTSQTDITPAPSNNTTEASQNTNEDIILYVVKQGETLFFISKTFHVDINRLRQINNLKDNKIKIGSLIKIPITSQPEVQETQIHQPEIVKENPVEKIEKTVPEQEQAVYHVVQPGETLYRIHINYHVPIEKLRKLNHIKGNYIKVGQKLRVK